MKLMWQQEPNTFAYGDGENGQGILYDSKSKVESAKYVVDNIVDHHDDGSAVLRAQFPRKYSVASKDPSATVRRTLQETGSTKRGAKLMKKSFCWNEGVTKSSGQTKVV